MRRLVLVILLLVVQAVVVIALVVFAVRHVRHVQTPDGWQAPVVRVADRAQSYPFLFVAYQGNSL